MQRYLLQKSIAYYLIQGIMPSNVVKSSQSALAVSNSGAVNSTGFLKDYRISIQFLDQLQQMNRRP